MQKRRSVSPFQGQSLLFSLGEFSPYFTKTPLNFLHVTVTDMMILLAGDKTQKKTSPLVSSSPLGLTARAVNSAHLREGWWETAFCVFHKLKVFTRQSHSPIFCVIQCYGKYHGNLEPGRPQIKPCPLTSQVVPEALVERSLMAN